MDLREVLDGYVVTTVPHTALHLVWTEPAVDDEDALPGPPAGVLAVLDDYRITRVPKAS